MSRATRCAFLLGLALIACLIARPAPAGTITYILNTYSGAGSFPMFGDSAAITLTGHIKTNGALGKLAQSDITGFDFQFKITDKTGTATHSFDNTDGFTWYFFQSELSATKKGLFFNFDETNGFPDRNMIDLGHTSGDFSELVFEGPTQGSSGGITISTNNAGGTLFLGVFLPKTGANQQIAATPIPGDLPLFASGLAMLGLLGRRRRR